MYNFNENTPLAALTVGQFFELYEQKKANKKPIVKEEPKIDRVGITEIRNLTGLSESQIYKLSAKNAIPCRKFGNRLVFSITVVSEWMELNTVSKETSRQKAARQLAKLAIKKSKNY